MSTEVTGGAAGAKVSVTPVAAVSIAVNTTTARAGESTTALGLSGKLSAHADQTDSITTKATGQAQGDVAVGASLAATVAVETVTASVDRDVSSSTAIDLGATSASSVRTEAVAGAKGAKSAAKDADGNETPEAGTTVDEQKKTQIDSAKSRTAETKTLDTDSKTPAAETPEVNKSDTTEVNSDGPPQKPTDPPTKDDKKEESKKVSVAAAIGVGVVVNQARATIGGAGRSVSTTGNLDVKSSTDTNYSTKATGEAVSDDIGVAAAVALTGTFNKTQANIAAGTSVIQAGDINVQATAKQNRDEAFSLDMGAEAVSGAGGGEVAVAGSLAVVGNYNETRASIDEDVDIGTSGASVGNVSVKADETSKIAARARAGTLSLGDKSKAGVGASFAALLSYNQNTAAVGYDTDPANPDAEPVSNIYANSLTVTSTKNRVDFESPLDQIPKSFSDATALFNEVKAFDFDRLDPLNYLGSNNYYTEALAGAAAKGNAAVAGAFAVNLFMNKTEAYLGQNVKLTTSGSQAGTHAEKLGLEVAAKSDTRAIAFAGAVAGAKKAGVGISNTDIINFDETNASVGSGSVVKVGAGGTAADNGVKVSADAKQVIANVAVSGGVGTESTGVGGVLGIDLSMNKAEAMIADGATVQAEGNVTVAATNDNTSVMIAGGVGAGKEAGVGGALAANGVWNRTYASIGKDAIVDAKKTIAVTADANETAVNAVIAGAGGGKAGVAGALSFNVIVADTQARVGEGAKLNTSAGFENAEKVAITARDDTVVVGVAGGGAGGGDAGVGAALDTTVLVKKVQAYIADDTVADGKVATVKADKEVSIDAAATDTIVSVSAGFAGGGKAGVGGAVSVGVVANDVQAYVGKSASVDSDGNVLVNAQDDMTAVLTAGAGAGGGNAGVGGSLAVATLIGTTKAYIGESAQVNARGLGAASSVYSGETVFSDTESQATTFLGKKKEDAKGLSVTAYNRENLITTVVGGAGGGTAGVAATVSANVIATTAEASIGRSARINENNATAGAEQQVRVKAIDETLLVDTAGAGAGGGSAGVGAAGNIGVIAKTTTAKIGTSTLVNAKQAVELDAASSDVSVSTAIGLAGGGSAGVGGAVGAVGVVNTTQAYIEDATSAANAAKVNVSGGDLALDANEFSSAWLISAGGGGGAAGVGGALSVGVNASTTKAKIGNYAETNASGTTAVHADSVENINTVTIAGAGGGSAGVSGSIAMHVVVSKTEAGIGDNAKVNQVAPGQNVDVKATDKIITVGAGGAGAGGGAAGVGGTADVTVVLNTTSAYIGNNALVDAQKDVNVEASSEKYVNSVTFAGAGGGAAGVAGAISVISVGSLLDGEAKSGLSTEDENGNATTMQSQADGQTTKSAVGDQLGTSTQSAETAGVLNSNASKLAVGQYMADTTPIPLKNTQAFIGHGAEVKAGENVNVSARDSTLAIVAAGAGAGGGAAGVAGTVGVVLLHDSAEAFIADGAKVDAGKTVSVAAQTSENVFNVGVTGAGAGAAAVNGSIAVNVVTSDTAAYIGAADVNKDATADAASAEQSVVVSADSASNIVTVAGSGGGAGAAAVGGVLNVNTLSKKTKAYIGEGADVAADRDVKVLANSAQNVIGAGISIHGAGAAAVGAVASANVVANTTEAFIGSARDDDSKSAAVVDSDGNVTLSAVDDTLVVAVSAVGNGAGAAGVGLNVGANVVSSQTRAYVADLSTVNARGNAAGSEVYSGTIDNATPAALAAVPGGGSGDIDLDRDGTVDGSVAGDPSFNVKAESDGGGDGGADGAANPAGAKGADGSAIAGASGGLGSKGKETVRGLSVVALGNEKMVTATIGVAGAGAAAVTGAATANVIVSETEASIGNGAKINTVAGGADPSVRVRATDNTFMVQTGGTVAGAGAAAVSGTVNTGIVAKKTHASIGDADVKAKNVEVSAAASEDIYNLTANVSIAGAAGVGAAVGVNVVTNETTASIGAGADIDASGDIRVKAAQDSAINLYTVAGAGGIVGVSGAASVGVIANKTRAYVEGAATPVAAATLNASGTTEIKAESTEDITSATISAAGGGVGVAGAVGVKVVASETAAFIGDNTRVNQARNGAAQDVVVTAADTVRLSGGGGTVSYSGIAGAGATAEINVVRNTTTAYIGDGVVLDADRDVSVTAAAVKDVQSAAVAAAGGGSVGIGGAVSVVSIGAKLDDDSQGGLSSSGTKGDTAAFVDGQIKQDKVSGELGDSEHVQGTKTNVSGRVGGLGVAGDLNSTSSSSLDKTRAYIGSGSQITTGRDVKVTATDKIKVDVNAVGAAGGFVGLGGAIGVATANSTTESFIGSASQIDAGGDVTVESAAGNVDANGALVRSAAGAGGVVGLSAAVAVMNDTSTTKAYLGSGSEIRNAQTLTVAANTERKARAEAIGASGGALAIGASVARAGFDGSTSTYFESGVRVGKTGGKTVDAVIIDATDESTAIALAVAGAAGILAGSGADASATMDSEVSAAMGSGADVVAQQKVGVGATATTQTDARAIGVNIGAGAVGASLANARSNATVAATLGTDSEITAANLDVLATRSVGASPTALARATGAAGGLLLGANATLAKAESTGSTSALVGADSTLTVSGVATVKADSKSQQTSSGEGLSTGFIAVGADYSFANSNTLTQVTLGDDVKVSGGTLQVLADSADSNYAYGVAGSGGLASAPFSAASTTNTSQTYARTGSGNTVRKIDVGSLLVSASHDANFDSWMDSTNASLLGVSGAQASNTVNTRSEAHIGTSGHIEADNITLQAHNDVLKHATGQIPGLSRNVPTWNVNSSSGGLADVPAAASSTTIVTNALVQVGAGAHLEQTGNRNSPGVYNLDAWNDVTASDKVKMSSGGAISAASAKSAVLADTNNAAVRIGDFAEMSSVGDIALGARSVAELNAQAAVDVYGAVGVAPAGESAASFLATNTIDIGAGATMESLRDIKLAAGANSSGSTNDISTTARTDVYNNTAIPVNRDPVADATIGTHSQINVGSGADIAAVRNVSLFAEEGAASASGVGIGKDIYREALAAVASAVSEAFGGDEVSFETRTGRSVRNQSSDVAVNGDVRVGIQRKQELVIGPDGTPTTQTDGISITATGFKDIAADIQSRINDLQNLIAEYTVADPSADASIAVAAYESEIRFLERKLKDLGMASGKVAASSISPLQAAQQSVAGMTSKRDSYGSDKTDLVNQNSTLNTQITSHQSTVTTNEATIAANNTTIAGLDTVDDAAQIATLTSQNATLASQNSTLLTTTIPGLQGQVASNNTEITSLTGKIDGLNTQISSVQTDIANNVYSNTPASGPVATFLSISDAEARLGNIYVRGDRLHGAGTLDAPGDAEIKITNNGPNFLVLKNLTIPSDEGGKLYFNSVDVKSNAEINNVNGTAGGAAFKVFTAESQFDSSGNPVTPAKPRILVESKYDPLDPLYIAQTPANTPALAPDIILQGDISNLRGLVKIDSAAGSIRLEQKRDGAGNLILPPETANVRADDVQISTRNGDFVQSYTDTFYHVAGAPLTITPGNPDLTPDTNPARFDTIVRTPESAGSGIVANGSVLIAARYLNINGNIQSGIPEWGVSVPANATVTIGAGSGTFAQAQAHYNALAPAQKAALGAEYYAVSGATVTGLTGNVQGNWEKMTVRFNAKENRLELGGVQVQGGYIELFGQIFNTNQSGGGKLRVLDGYGQIKVDNQTSLPLWVNTLDTGRGVKGEINITNITGLDADGRPIITTTTYTRDPGASRTGGFYNPTSGVRYAMSVGKDYGKKDNYRYSTGAIIGIKVFPENLDDYWLSGVTLENDPLSQGEFLGTLPGSGSAHYFARTQVKTTSGEPVTTKEWFECNWWTLCAVGTYYKEFNITSATKTVTTDSVRADYPIGIEYIGFDQGAVNVSSTGNVVMNASINNRDGNTSVSSVGSITQNGDLPIIGGNNVTLSAGTGIGATAQSLLVNVKAGGKLDAISAAGDVRVGQVVGDLLVGTVGGAGVANVKLEADRNLLPWDVASYVQGQRVELLSRNGGIGTLSDTVNEPLIVRTGYTTNQAQWPNNGLMATARDNINIRNVADPGNASLYTGNLLLISAESLAGDVRIEAAGGVIDNNPYATTDTRTEQELANLWDSLRLRGALAVEKADEAVAAFENGKSNNYQLYWQLRKRQSDQGAAYDPNFQYAVSQAEHDALAASGMSEGQITDFAANRTTQYHQLNAEVGGLTDTYAAGFRYEATVEEETQIRKGSSWTDAQLALSVGAGLLKNITDTVTTIKEPNAKGRNITLVAGSDIGSFNDPLTIDLSAGLDTLTTAQKAALAAAERGDATLAGDIITINQPRPVNVTIGSGALNATAATGLAFIGSEQDLRIDRISAAGDIRIKTAGSLVSAGSVAGAANVIGGSMILEAANGGIGSVPDGNGAVASPLRISPAVNAGVIARAANDIWIEAPNDLAVDTMFSRGNLRLDAGGSILDFHGGESSIAPDNNLRSNSMWLTALAGTIGAPGNPLDAGVNPDGFITATASTFGNGVYLNGPSGENFNIGSVTSGDAVALSSATGMQIDGAVTGPGPISLVAGGTMTMTPRADVHVTTLGVFLRAGALTMQDADRMQAEAMPDADKFNAGDAARMLVDVGTIDIETVGDALITGIETGNGTESAIRVVSTAGRILDNGDTRLDIIADTQPAAKLTIDGALGIGDDPLDVRLLNLQATSGGVVDLAVAGPVNIVSVLAADRVLFTADGSITGNSISSTGLGSGTDQTISVTSATGTLSLASVSGTTDIAVAGQSGVAVGVLSSTGGSVLAAASTGNVQVGTVTADAVALSAPGSVIADGINVGSSFQLAGGNIAATVNGGAGAVTGSITGFAGGIASNVDLTLSGAGGFVLDNFWTASASVGIPVGTLAIGNAIILDQATFVNPLTLLLVDQNNKRIQPADIQLYSGGDPFSMYLSGNSLETNTFVIHRSPMHEVVTPSGTNTSVVEQGEAMLARVVVPAADDERSKGVADNDALVTYIEGAVSLECQRDQDPDCTK
ncbi:MAG: hypothetical protein KJ787_00105 [Gammaproteobacteria bacterium]|nr:hypothetical protein [Gammaproteobacteria bacterium]MBU1644721.1 hypothetical protein [Gammaproteobacteria bacterium]MBU1973455.1 hypothetical protein [Gammaproteobacteria bacterium]